MSLNKDNHFNIAVKVNGGSGVLLKIGSDVFVLTALHCLCDSDDKNKVLSYDGTTSYEILDIYHDKDKKNDVALLKVEASLNIVIRGTSNFSVDDKLKVYGFPSNGESEGTLMSAKVSNLSTGLVIETDLAYSNGTQVHNEPIIANIQGWSGSGVFKEAENGDLYLIGMVASVTNREHTYQTVRCVTLDVILELVGVNGLGEFLLLSEIKKLNKLGKEITELIKQKESPKLDFKREWYSKEKLKTELIKDIIALTNGNIHTIGQPSYLIIGIKESENGNEVCGVELEISVDDIKKQLLQNLQNYATPAIQDIDMEEFELESKNVFVITIPFHPYLVILKQKLRQYEKDTLLYRAGEGTVSADFATRKAFEEALEKYVGNNEERVSTVTTENSLENITDSELSIDSDNINMKNSANNIKNSTIKIGS